MSRELPEKQLQLEAMLRELTGLQQQLSDLCLWARTTRTSLEQGPEDLDPKVPQHTPSSTQQTGLFLFHVTSWHHPAGEG